MIFKFTTGDNHQISSGEILCVCGVPPLFYLNSTVFSYFILKAVTFLLL